jgi:beta-1,4-mannooligosaccharide/beta-1,4-mannosyl-N-acetylglucosamine phosphorylase
MAYSSKQSRSLRSPPHTSALLDPPSGRIAIYYGGADTATALACAYLDEVLDFVKSNSKL